MKAQTLSALLLLLAAAPFASAQAGTVALQVVSGNCRLETSGEIINLENKDPFQHYGMFAEGFSKEGDRIYLAQYEPDSIMISIHSSPSNLSSSSNSMTDFALSASGTTRVRASLTVQRADNPRSEWLSCDLKIQ